MRQIAYLRIFHDGAGNGTVTQHGFDQPDGILMQFDVGERHLYLKVPGHKYAFTNHPTYDGYAYAPVSHEVWEFTDEPITEGSGVRIQTHGKAIRRLQWGN